MRGPLPAVVACSIVFVAGCRSKPDPPRVMINGKVWFVDLATTEQQRHQGLSYRSSLEDNAGMLFIYPRPRNLSYCMRGCLISLDIAFIDANRHVVMTHTMSAGDWNGEVAYKSEQPAQFALEVAAGSLARAGVRVGDEAAFLGDIPEATKAQDGP